MHVRYIFPNIFHLTISYCVCIGARWDFVDIWFSGRLAKSIDQTARIAAQLNHIELSMKLLKDFVSIYEFNTFGSISFEIYSGLADFIEKTYPPLGNTVIEITGKTTVLYNIYGGDRF